MPCRCPVFVIYAYQVVTNFSNGEVSKVLKLYSAHASRSAMPAHARCKFLTLKALQSRRHFEAAIRSHPHPAALTLQRAPV
jgi:hypothetical protein